MTLTLERQAFSVEPLSPVLGASIVGLDLREPLSEETKRAVYDAFVRHHVLCFRDQHLDQEQQIAFTQQFGTLERHIASNPAIKIKLERTPAKIGRRRKKAEKFIAEQGLEI